MEALDGLPGTYVIADIVLITGECETMQDGDLDHDNKLCRLLQRAGGTAHRRPEVLKRDREKVWAISDMPLPSNVKGVQRLVGMVNYLALWAPFQWLQSSETTHTQRQIVGLKEKITLIPVLKYYDPELELTLQCDAIETGLGAADPLHMEVGH